MERYERLKILGKGTFGKAWLVKDRETGQELVAKEIKVENKQDLDDALSEANVLSRLNHINIVKYQDVIRSSSKLVIIVMEYCDDGDVSEKIARRKFKSQFFEESLVLMWFVQTTQALDYIHKKGMIHRDIKTANLFLNKKGFIKLGDFGIARVLDRNAERVGQRTAKTPVGTPMYMSPEQCTGQKYTQKADIWALGCVLYEMATLRPAFMAHSMEGLMAKIKNGHHDKYLPKHLSANMNTLITRMLNVDEKKRPSTEELLALEYLAPYIAQSPHVVSEGGAAPQKAQPLPTLPQQETQKVPEVMVIHDDSQKPTVLSKQANWGQQPATASPQMPRGRYGSQPEAVSPITGLKVASQSPAGMRRSSSPAPSSAGMRAPPGGQALDYRSWQQQQHQQPAGSPLGLAGQRAPQRNGYAK